MSTLAWPLTTLIVFAVLVWRADKWADKYFAHEKHLGALQHLGIRVNDLTDRAASTQDRNESAFAQLLERVEKLETQLRVTPPVGKSRTTEELARFR